MTQIMAAVAGSATGPRSLHDAGLFAAHRIIAHNRMELVLRPGLKADCDDPLVLLADPRWRIGMSTSEDVIDFLAYLCGNVTRRKLEEAGFLLASV